jgi:hypothetical protein
VSDEVVARIPPIVDLDAHLVEPEDVWTARLPAKYREIGPHVEYLPGGNAIFPAPARSCGLMAAL